MDAWLQPSLVSGSWGRHVTSAAVKPLHVQGLRAAPATAAAFVNNAPDEPGSTVRFSDTAAATGMFRLCTTGTAHTAPPTAAAPLMSDRRSMPVFCDSAI